MKLWLVRHAQPLIAAGVCYGATDVAADPQATLQAAHELAGWLPQGQKLVSSPLKRCDQLAQCLRLLRPDVSCKTDARLAEMDFGTWEGQRWDAIPKADIERWTADFANYRFGAIENVESFMRRVASVWDETQQAAEDAVWITHAGVIRAASLLALGVRQVKHAGQWPRAAPAFGQWCQLQA